MTHDSLLIFTRDPLEVNINRGFIGYYKFGLNRALKSKYAIVCQNGGFNHGAATHIVKIHKFLVGEDAEKYAGVQIDADRKIVLFNQFAKIYIPNAWPGFQNPVTYVNAEDLNIKFDKLDWIDVAADKPQTLSVEDAKVLLAKTFNVSPSAIKISIEM